MEIRFRHQLNSLLDHFSLPKVVAELGTAEMRFSKYILENWGIDILYAIDIYKKIPFISGCAYFDEEWHSNNYSEALKLKNKYPDNIVILKGFTYEMADSIPDNSLGLVYIDADHSYEGCKTDINYYYPKLINGGIMAFHDAYNEDYGVNRSMTEFSSIRNIDINKIEEDSDIANMGAWIQKPLS